MNAIRCLVITLAGVMSVISLIPSARAAEAGAMDKVTARLIIRVRGYESTETVNTVPEPDEYQVNLNSLKKQTRTLPTDCYLRLEYLSAPQDEGLKRYDQGLYDVWTGCLVDNDWVVSVQEQMFFFELADFSAVSLFGIISLSDLTSTTGVVDVIQSQGSAFAKPTKNGGRITFLAGNGYAVIEDSDSHVVDGATKVVARTIPLTRLPAGLDEAFNAAMGL